LTLITYPKAGHGPHHQYLEAAAAQIAAFINGHAQSGNSMGGSLTAGRAADWGASLPGRPV